MAPLLIDTPAGYHPPTKKRRATRQPRRSPPALPATTELVATILDGAASAAANTYAVALSLALRLHDERHGDAALARDVALSLASIAEEAHRAAELVAKIGGVRWQ